MSSTASIHSLVQSDPARAEAVAWAQFTTPSSAGEFNASWLGILCAQMAQAKGALLLLRDETDAGGASFVAAAVWPDATRPMQDLGPAATRTLQERRGLVVGADGSEPPGRDQPVHIGYPIEVDGQMHGAVVVHLASRALVARSQAAIGPVNLDVVDRGHRPLGPQGQQLLPNLLACRFRRELPQRRQALDLAQATKDGQERVEALPRQLGAGQHEPGQSLAHGIDDAKRPNLGFGHQTAAPAGQTRRQ
mgnify:CR=1 FL=1